MFIAKHPVKGVRWIEMGRVIPPLPEGITKHPVKGARWGLNRQLKQEVNPEKTSEKLM